MSDALAKVFAIQQREINRKMQAQMQADARAARECAAFSSSPVCQMIREFADLSVKPDAVSYIPNGDRPLFKHTMWDHDRVVAGKRNSVELRVGPNESIRFSCQENRDSGRMMYLVKSGGLTYERATPDTEFTTLFVEYAAKVLVPNAVEAAMAPAAEETPSGSSGSRRRLQAV